MELTKKLKKPEACDMPELPEVENVALALRAHLSGRKLTALEVGYPGILGQSIAATQQALLGRILNGVHRHGKYIIINFSDGEQTDTHLMIHLRMTGQIFILEDYIPDKHVHLKFDFDGQPVYYRDIRKFGRIELVDHPIHPSNINHVGPDMLEIRFKAWLERIGHRKASIKALLLDQGIAAGLGNIYVDETLFLAGVHPLSKPVDLNEDELHEIWQVAKRVLRHSIKHGGTTFMDFKNFHGKPGNFRQKLKVYGRAGENCSICKCEIQTLRIAGRSSCFCPECQVV